MTTAEQRSDEGRKSKQRGHALENRAGNYLKSLGWTVIRSAGSHGAGDLVVGRDGRTLLIEVKGTAASRFADFGPQARARTIREAANAGWECWLFWCPKGRTISQGEWIASADWPGTDDLREAA